MCVCVYCKCTLKCLYFGTFYTLILLLFTTCTSTRKAWKRETGDWRLSTGSRAIIGFVLSSFWPSRTPFQRKLTHMSCLYTVSSPRITSIFYVLAASNVERSRVLVYHSNFVALFFCWLMSVLSILILRLNQRSDVPNLFSNFFSSLNFTHNFLFFNTTETNTQDPKLLIFDEKKKKSQHQNISISLSLS